VDQGAKDVLQIGDKAFTDKSGLDSLWQEIALNFYPQRADFLASRHIGSEFADHLTTSYPIIANRELTDAVSAMLRPRGQKWYGVKLQNRENIDAAGRKWLEERGDLMRGYMYGKSANFIKAMKQCDGDFSPFGNAVGSVFVNRDNDGLIYQNWHPRDCAWFENAEGSVDTLHRKWKPTYRNVATMFKGKCCPKFMEKAEKNPHESCNVRHVMMPSEDYEGLKAAGRHPYVSLYIDVENEHILEEAGAPEFNYFVSRWQTLSGSQYAYSPATVAALPDARLIQAISLTLLEAGEKAANPPMVATQEAIRSDLNLMSGGITWIDYQYDERLGEALRPLTTDKSGLSFGQSLREESRFAISEAFYLNKLNLPTNGAEMTAYEIGQRVQEYIRNALPLFEPLEIESNAAVCERTFAILMRVGAFGPASDMPRSLLQGDEVAFDFFNPLTEGYGRDKGNKFIETKNLLREAAELDMAAGFVLDPTKALRDVLEGIQTPAAWLRDEEEANAAASQYAAQQQAATAAQLANEGGAALNQFAQAGKTMQEAQRMGS
jgi:hypothetical protein